MYINCLTVARPAASFLFESSLLALATLDSANPRCSGRGKLFSIGNRASSRIPRNARSGIIKRRARRAIDSFALDGFREVFSFREYWTLRACRLETNLLLQLSGLGTDDWLRYWLGRNAAFDRRGGARGTRLDQTRTCLATRLLTARGHGRLCRGATADPFISPSREITVLISNGSTLFARVHANVISLRRAVYTLGRLNGESIAGMTL